MAVILTFSLLVLAALVTSDNACDGNLVQSLQQCAAAISGNEPLSVQQEKCSPNGCNYDCPALVAVDTLNQQVANMNSTIAYLVGQVADAHKYVNNLYQTFQNTTEAINTNLNTLSDAIGGTGTNLSLAIASVSKDITSNTENIKELSNRVEEYHGYCGSNAWTLAAELNMSDPNTDCPSAFSLYVSGHIRACRRQFSLVGSCDSLIIPVDAPYSEVCGRFEGHVFGTPDAIHQEPHEGDTHNNINSYYADGVSLTYGSPRTHIWTFMAGYMEDGTFTNRCPCNPNSQAVVQSFVGNDYYCESGIDILWDGECSQGEITCCQPSNLPYFHKVLESETSSSLEIRICGDQDTAGEDVPVSFYEIYVK